MSVDFSRIEAICFDIDGTLNDTDDQFVKKIVKLLSPAAFIFRHREILPFARKLVMFSDNPGNWVYSLADRIGLDNSLVGIGEFLHDLGIEKSPEPYYLIKGVREMLVALRNKFPLSIISARGQKSTYRFLFQYELLPYFKAVSTGQTCPHTKPFPDQVIWAAEKMGVAVSSCLMVGDTVVDILAGKNAGAQTIGVLCGFGDENELRHAGADLILENTPDLLQFFATSGTDLVRDDYQI
jgi:N-acetyl-D-muramate 6-phosphate phosphatase